MPVPSRAARPSISSGTALPYRTSIRIRISISAAALQLQTQNRLVGATEHPRKRPVPGQSRANPRSSSLPSNFSLTRTPALTLCATTTYSTLHYTTLPRPSLWRPVCFAVFALSLLLPSFPPHVQAALRCERPHLVVHFFASVLSVAFAEASFSTVLSCLRCACRALSSCAAPRCVAVVVVVVVVSCAFRCRPYNQYSSHQLGATDLDVPPGTRPFNPARSPSSPTPVHQLRSCRALRLPPVPPTEQSNSNPPARPSVLCLSPLDIDHRTSVAQQHRCGQGSLHPCACATSRRLRPTRCDRCSVSRANCHRPFVRLHCSRIPLPTFTSHQRPCTTSSTTIPIL